MRPTTTTFLRRTFVLLGAALALAAGTPAMAQGKVTLSGASGNSCDYTEMKVTPNGNITVTCGSASVNVANFALSHASSSTNYVLAPNTASSATVTRSGGPAGESLMVTYSVSGSGCSTNSGGILLNVNQSQTIPFSVGAAGTSCVVTIGVASGGGHTASPHTLTFTAQSSTNPPPPPPPPGTPGDCPAMPSSSSAGSSTVNDFQSVDQRKAASGAITYYQVPAPPNAMSVIVEFSQTQMANTPGGAITEFQVSRCPGVFDPPGHTIAAQCRYNNSQINMNNLKIWTAPVGQWTSQDTLLGEGNCMLPTQGQTYYINVRWTYPSCPFSSGCGFSNRWIQWNGNYP